MLATAELPKAAASKVSVLVKVHDWPTAHAEALVTVKPKVLPVPWHKLIWLPGEGPAGLEATIGSGLTV